MKIRYYDFRKNDILIMNLIVIWRAQSSNMPLLRNEFLKIFEDLFTMTLFTKTTQIYDQTKN